jgi:hypothetical protein
MERLIIFNIKRSRPQWTENLTLHGDDVIIIKFTLLLDVTYSPVKNTKFEDH